MEKSKVYFTRDLSPAGAIRAFEALGIKLEGNVGVKLHSGEPGNQNFLRPAFMKDIVDHVNGTILECNTAYDGGRNTTEAHRKTMLLHGWTEIADVDIMDAEGDMELPVKGGKHLEVNFVGKNLANYDSILVLSHFKGHPRGGFGGALKNMSIGVASSHGKAHIHGAGKPEDIWTADHDSFLESMAEACSAVMDYFGRKNIVYINVANNLSVDCDCDSNPHAPEMADIGIFASLDPVALDQACVDAVYASKDPGKTALIERIESRNGMHTVETAEKLMLGSREYEIVSID